MISWGCAFIVATGSSLPYSAKTAVIASAYTSARASASCGRSISSGAAYRNVPIAPVRVPPVVSGAAARSKSVSRGAPEMSSRTFAGFTSRCTMPFACASASASATPRTIATARSRAMRPSSTARCRSPPATRSITKYSQPASSPREAQHPHHGLVAQGRHHARAAEEPFAARLIARHLRVQHLDRDVFVSLTIDRRPHRSKPAAPEELEQQVPAAPQRVPGAEPPTLPEPPAEVEDLAVHLRRARLRFEQRSAAPASLLDLLGEHATRFVFVVRLRLRRPCSSPGLRGAPRSASTAPRIPVATSAHASSRLSQLVTARLLRGRGVRSAKGPFSQSQARTRTGTASASPFRARSSAGTVSSSWRASDAR